MSDETTQAPTRVQCEPGGTVYCDDYEAIVGPKPDAAPDATVIATKVVQPDATQVAPAEVVTPVQAAPEPQV